MSTGREERVVGLDARLRALGEIERAAIDAAVEAGQEWLTERPAGVDAEYERLAALTGISGDELQARAFEAAGMGRCEI